MLNITSLLDDMVTSPTGPRMLTAEYIMIPLYDYLFQIAMISPGIGCCEHTLNTLRYADR